VNVYADLLLTFDYPANQVTFQSGALASDAEDVVKYRPGPGGAPLVDLVIGGVKVSAQVDTAAAALLLMPESMASKVKFISGPVPGAVARGPQVGRVEARDARLDGDLLLGRYIVHQPLVRLVDRPEVLIGDGLLAYFALTLDQKTHSIRFSRASTDPITIPRQAWETKKSGT